MKVLYYGNHDHFADAHGDHQLGTHRGQISMWRTQPYYKTPGCVMYSYERGKTPGDLRLIYGAMYYAATVVHRGPLLKQRVFWYLAPLQVVQVPQNVSTEVK